MLYQELMKGLFNLSSMRASTLLSGRDQVFMNYDWVEANKDTLLPPCACHLDHGKYCYWFPVHAFDPKMLTKDYITSSQICAKTYDMYSCKQCLLSQSWYRNNDQKEIECECKCFQRKITNVTDIWEFILLLVWLLESEIWVGGSVCDFCGECYECCDKWRVNTMEIT